MLQRSFDKVNLPTVVKVQSKNPLHGFFKVKSK